MKRLKTMIMACGLLTSNIACLKAAEWDKETRVTIAHELQVGNTLLAPGRYMLRVAESSSDRDVVQIFTGDGRIKATILAFPAYRLEPASTSELTISTAEVGQPATLLSWFYPGDNYGRAFPGPNQSEGRLSKRVRKSQGAGQEGDGGGR